MSEEIPERLGRYEILEELGRGAMGLVYLARDPIIGRQVALKVLRLPHLSDVEEVEQFRRRFIREAQSAGILAHPNIVTVHDVVEGNGEGATFIAMEYISGTNLKELLRPGEPLELSFVSEVVTQVAAALDYAHARGVVHRDVKPANILLDREGQVRITDFGIARLETSNLTQDTTKLLGTPNYMAPEQVRGLDIDHRVDIFALGVMVYEMVTASKPFQGETVAEVTHRVAYEAHPPASERYPGLPAALDRLLDRALSKDPGERFGRAGELAEELERLAEARARGEARLNATQVVDRATVPPPPGDEAAGRPGPSPDETQPTGSVAASVSGGAGWLERLYGSPWKRWLSPRNLALVGGALLVLVLALGLGIFLLAGSPEEEVEPPPDPRYQQLLSRGYELLSLGDPGQAAAVFRDAERLQPTAREARTWRQLAERQAEALERMTELQRRLGRQLASAQLALSDGRFDQAIARADEVLQLAGEELRAEDPEVVAQATEIRRRALEGREERRRAVEERRREARQRAAAAGTEEEAEGGEARRAEEERAGSASREVAAPAREPVAAGPPTLEMVFTSERPQGSVTIFVGEESFLSQGFRFLERKGFLGIRGTETYEGRLYLEPTEVEAGTQTLRIYVTPKGEAAMAEILEGVELEHGDQRTLRIHLPAEGELQVQLE